MPQVGGHAILVHERLSRPRYEREDIMNSIHDVFRAHGLVRVRDGRILGGVAAGLGRRTGLDPWPARLLFLLALLVIPGSQILLYPILWILMPLERPGDLPLAANSPTRGQQSA